MAKKPKPQSTEQMYLQDLQGLLYEIAFLNDRIDQGDIVSAEKALPLAKKAAEKVKKAMLEHGAYDVFLDPYVAFGGWVGITVAYADKENALTRVQMSQTPRRRWTLRVISRLRYYTFFIGLLTPLKMRRC